jgi:hypothetical protein
MLATQTGEMHIETTLEDIEEANKLLKEILLSKSDELTGACRKYFEQLKEYITEKNNSKSGADFMNREMSQKLRIPITTVKRYHLELLNNGRIKLLESKKTEGYKYEIIDLEEYKKLKNSIDTVLDEILKKINDQPSSSNLVQTKNGLPKNKKTNQLQA